MTKTLLFILGLKRNGNHPIIHWLISNLGKNNLKIGFINDVNEKKLTKDYIRNIINDNDVTILSYEEISIDQFNKIKYKCDTNIQEKFFLILRDFPNSFASRKKYISDFKSDKIDIYKYFMDDYEYKKQWINFANIFINNTSNQFVCLNYNYWFVSKKYRDLFLNNNFKLLNYDLGLLFVPANAGGSSFDGVTYSGKAKEMNTLERWHYYKEDKYFIDFVIKDEYLMNLNNKIFQNLNLIK